MYRNTEKSRSMQMVYGERLVAILRKKQIHEMKDLFFRIHRQYGQNSIQTTKK